MNMKKRIKELSYQVEEYKTKYEDAKKTVLEGLSILGEKYTNKS